VDSTGGYLLYRILLVVSTQRSLEAIAVLDSTAFLTAAHSSRQASPGRECTKMSFPALSLRAGAMALSLLAGVLTLAEPVSTAKTKEDPDKETKGTSRNNFRFCRVIGVPLI